MPKVTVAASDEAAASGDFDLNATPRGFDLNAPLPEEEADWMPAEVKETAVPDDKPLQKPRKRARSGASKQQVEPAAKLGIDEDLDILQSVLSSQDDPEQLDGILAGLCEDIAKHQSGPPRYQYLTCIYISKKLPNAFSLPRATKALLSFLDPNAPGKKQNVLPVLACTILYRAFSEEAQWPLDFVKAYLEDAVSARSWVDNESCNEFVANVLTAFRHDDQDVFPENDSQENTSKVDASSNNQTTMVIKNRYPNDDVRQEARLEFLAALNQAVRAPSSKDSPRILLRFLMLGVCYEEVRNVASTMLESWLNNPLHFRGAKLLLDRLIYHTNTTSAQDLDTVTNILAFKLNPQAVGQAKSLYADIVLQMVQKRPEYSSHALKTFLTAEINQKAAQNVKGILAVLRALPDSQSPERELASVIKELLVKPEHANRLHDAVGRVMKQLNREGGLFLLGRALLEPWPSIQEEEEPVRQAWLNGVADLACRQLIQAASTLPIDENVLSAISSPGVSTLSDSFKEAFSQLDAFSLKVMAFQVDALTWCIDVLNAVLPQTSTAQFSGLVRKLQFLEPFQEYSLSSSNSDAELNSFQLVAYCMHASEEILARVILMGISSQFPMVQADALDIIENLVWRAAASRNHVSGTLFADNNQLPAAIVKLSSMNIAQQQQFVLKDMFWRSCLVIAVIAVHNPSTIGRSVWDSLMPLKCLLQCLVTGTTTLSQEDLKVEEAEALKSNVKTEEAIQALVAEAGSSSEASIPQWEGNVMLLSSANEATQVPSYVLEELVQINKIYQLDRRLRRCPDPNFLKETINSQEFHQAWSWIKEVVINDPEVTEFLPSDWQCELLYMHERSKTFGHEPAFRLQELRISICKLMEEDNATRDEAFRVIKRLAAKLMSPSCAARSCARRCFSAFLKEVETSHANSPTVFTDCSWLEVIEKLPAAPGILDTMVFSLQQALIYESSTPVILSYLSFLKRHSSPASFTCAFSRLMVQRKLIGFSLLRMPVANVILEVISNTMHDCRQKGVFDWENADLQLVSLTSTEATFTVPAIVLEAVVEILVATSSSDFRAKASYCQLLQLLFPGFTGADAGDRTMALKKLDTGMTVPFLTKLQASLLVRTEDIRLVRAGLSVLGFSEKIQLLQELRLSAEAKSCLAEELRDLPDASLKTLPSLTTRERLHLQSCLEALCGSSGASSQSVPSKMNCSEPPEQKITKQIVDPITDNKPGTGNYLPLRMLVQKLAAGASGDSLSSVLDALKCLLDSQDGSQAASLMLLLPVITLLVEAGKTEPTNILEVVTLLLKIIPELRRNSQASSAVQNILRRLENRLAAKLENIDADSEEEVITDMSLGKLEQSLRKQLCGRLESYLKQDGKSGSISSVLHYVISRLREQGSHSEGLSDIEVAGSYGLLMSLLSFIHLDVPETDIPLVFTEQLMKGRHLELAALILDYLFHKCKNKSSSLAQLLWGAVVQNIDTENLGQTLTEASCLAAGLLLEFLLHAKNAVRFGSSSSQVLATLAVISCTTKSDNRKHIVSTAIQLLLCAASSDGVMHFVIEQLKHLSRRNEGETARTATELLCALYMGCPVTVGCGLELASIGSDFLMNAPQAFGFRDIVNQAMTTVFLNPRNTSTSALCSYFARKHPGLFIRQFSTMRLRLLEIWGNLEPRAALLIFTIEILDKLRPLFGDQSFTLKCYDDLEALLALFFKVLGNPDASCTEQFVSQVATFLCHVVSGGGRLSQLVIAQKQAIQPAFMKFGRLRKLGELMQLLDMQSLPAPASEAEEAVIEISMTEVCNVLSIPPENEDTWDILGVNDQCNAPILNLVSDLERASSSVLVNVQELVARLMTMENVEVQQRASVLVTRLLQENSGKTCQAFVDEILRQIASPGTTQQQLELITQHISRLFYYFEEFQQDILTELFSRGKAVSKCLNQIVSDAQLV